MLSVGPGRGGKPLTGVDSPKGKEGRTIERSGNRLDRHQENSRV